MKTKIKLGIAAICIGMSFLAVAQTNVPLPIKGNIDIKFNSRQTIPPQKGVKDIYILQVNMANSTVFRGTISDTPQLIYGWVSKTVVQPRSLTYSIDCDVINPRNPSQTKNVGRMFGNVRIDPDGSYRYDTGSLTVEVLPIGNAGGFSSKFNGITVGKPLGRPANWMDTLKRETVNITRSVNGKTTTVSLKKYDKMEFRQHVIGAGPVAIYQPITVNGDMLYDYDKSCWFFNNLTVQYVDNTTMRVDRLSGTIRWVDKANEYQFDIRLNEPPPNANAAFETKVADEASFFETDTTIPSLTGTMVYKDVKKGDVTLSSAVAIDLLGNNINKQQSMYLTKIIIFSCVVPMNSD